ncbi:WD40-repeat-containing domain protein [Geopyxis carbonaria]|nr:WD40-repeat-containing domain protein [Geopyxis carbonaria]
MASISPVSLPTVEHGSGICKLRNLESTLKSVEASLQLRFRQSPKYWPMLRMEEPSLCGKITDIAFSPNSRLLASAYDDGIVRLCDPTTGESRGNLVGHCVSVNAVVFSPDGQVLTSVSDDGTIRLWDLSGALLEASNRDAKTQFSLDEVSQPADGLCVTGDWIVWKDEKILHLPPESRVQLQENTINVQDVHGGTWCVKLDLDAIPLSVFTSF